MRSYLVVGNQTLAGPELTAAIAERIAADEPSRFHVVVPATPVQGSFTWDEDKAYAAAEERLEAMLTQLRAMGAEATGEVGHKDPVEAARDALRGFSADEVDPLDPARRHLALARTGRAHPTDGLRAGAGRGRHRRAGQDPVRGALRQAQRALVCRRRAARVGR